MKSETDALNVGRDALPRVRDHAVDEPSAKNRTGRSATLPSNK
jgi:hypothetical protein